MTFQKHQTSPCEICLYSGSEKQEGIAFCFQFHFPALNSHLRGNEIVRRIIIDKLYSWFNLNWIIFKEQLGIFFILKLSVLLQRSPCTILVYTSTFGSPDCFGSVCNSSCAVLLLHSLLQRKKSLSRFKLVSVSGGFFWVLGFFLCVVLFYFGLGCFGFSLVWAVQLCWFF